MAIGNVDWFWRMCDVVRVFPLSDGRYQSRFESRTETYSCVVGNEEKFDFGIYDGGRGVDIIFSRAD